MMHKSETDRKAQQLHFAIRIGNIDYIKTMLADGVDLDEVNRDGDTPLDVAAKNGDVEVAKCLLNAGANVNFTDKKDNTALHKASQEGNLQIVECLVNAKVNISIANKDGDSALDVAAKHGKLDVVEFLLSKGASTYTRCETNTNGDTTLHKAAKWNKLEVVKYLINKHGMDINTVTETEQDTPLHVAAKWGVEEVAKWLLNVRADFTITNREGYTPLYCAIKWKNKKVEKYLRDAGATEDAIATPTYHCRDDPMKEIVFANITDKLHLLDFPTLVPFLNKYNLLTDDDRYELLNNLIPPLQRANKLVYIILPSKGPRAFTSFVKCLREEKQHMGHQKLVEIFTSST